MGRPLGRALLLAGSLAIAGCGGQEAYAPEAGTSAASMFEQGCAHCHGAQGRGKFGFLLALQDSDLAQPDIEALIANGEGIMPAFPHLSADQRRQLAAYVRGL
ncbi:MAG TPA: cytochrome c [Gammaproteobacteria bacterium]|nr:cytochrome c [Gammaproteobacteria bacterium]